MLYDDQTFMKKLLFAPFCAAALLLSPAVPQLFGQQSSNGNSNSSGPVTFGAQTNVGQTGQASAPRQTAPAPAAPTLVDSANPADPALADPAEQTDTAGLDRQTAPQVARRVAQPVVLSGFQQLVQRTFGEPLPLFGHDLFTNPSTFAALPDAPPTTDYILSTGDQVLVRMWGPVTMNEALTVDRAGNIFLPQVGTIHVAGLSYAALSGHVHDEIARVFRNFNLSVDLGRLHSIQIFVTGEAGRPGTYTVSSLSTLVNAVFASGGPSPVGSMRGVQLRRDGQVVTTFDFYDLLLHGDKSKDAHLLPGDVIFIPPVGPQVGFLGQVKVPAIFELKGAETLGSLIELAGGPTTVASSSGVMLQQIVHHEYRDSRTLPLTPAGLATPLADGDVLSLGGISNRFENVVTVRGNLASPGRFAWHTGMRLSEVLPEKAALLTPSYWEVRNAEGRPSAFIEALPPDAAGQYAAASTLGHSVAALPASRGGIVTPGVGTDDTEAQGGVTPRVTVAPSRITRVTIPAPEIDWAYAVIERTDRETLRNQLIPFNLGRLVLDHDQTQDLELQAGDVVTIFSQADFDVAQEQLTKFVRIEGEVGSAGVYSVHPGETLQSLVARAGGLTPQAYLFGAQFTRESTRALQQQRLEEYTDKLSIEMERSTAKQALSLSSSGGDATAYAVEQQMLTQLRQQRATGRIVLDFKLDSAGVDTIPQLGLENGDVLIVPSKPLTINVIGSVPNQSSFLFHPGATVKYYLALAGRPDRDSDPKHAFVIRANGAVLSRQGSGFWGSTFEGLVLAPGDTLVIPAKLFSVGPLRTILDSSNAFSSIALIAASIAIAR